MSLDTRFSEAASASFGLERPHQHPKPIDSGLSHRPYRITTDAGQFTFKRMVANADTPESPFTGVPSRVAAAGEHRGHSRHIAPLESAVREGQAAPRSRHVLPTAISMPSTSSVLPLVCSSSPAPASAIRDEPRSHDRPLPPHFHNLDHDPARGAWVTIDGPSLPMVSWRQPSSG